MLSNHNSTLTIRVENLSKLYKLQAHQGSLRETLTYHLKHSILRRNGDEQKTLWALKGVNFELHQGEALGIVGPNGAGKTTILKILTRVTYPTEGQVKVNGRLGALLELSAGFHPELTGRENIFLYGSILGLSHREIQAKFEKIVDFSGLERFIDIPVKRYSSGMYVRLGFSVASHTDPEVLLVDEVLAVGDAEFRQKCIGRIKSLQQQGVSTIFISHNLFQMRTVCERGLFLLGGEIQEAGAIDQAIGAYENWLRRGDKLNTPAGSFEFVAGQGGSDLRLMGINLTSPDGQLQTQFNYLDPIEIQIHYSAARKFSSLCFVLRIMRLDGTLCSMLRSSDLGLRLDDIEGQGYIAIRLAELLLTSGSYVIEARLRDSEDAVTLAKIGSSAFDVDGPGLSKDLDKGVFLPRLTDVSVRNESPLLIDPGSMNGDKAHSG